MANFQLSVSQILTYLPFFRMEIITKIFKFYIHINFHYLLSMGWIERPPLFFRWLTPGGLFRLPDRGKRKRVYLTFDDGPVPEVTPWVLDVLDRYGIKATFFMVGENAMRYPGLLKEVIARGHAIGNHTHHHLAGQSVSCRRYLRDVAEAAGHLPTTLFRPPHGWLRPRQTLALRKRYRIVMYDLVTRDYSRRLNAGDVVRNVRRYARNGSVIVFHDSIKAFPRLEKALPEALEWLLEEGYEFSIIQQK